MLNLINDYINWSINYLMINLIRISNFDTLIILHTQIRTLIILDI